MKLIKLSQGELRVGGGGGGGGGGGVLFFEKKNLAGI